MTPLAHQFIRVTRRRAAPMTLLAHQFIHVTGAAQLP